MTPRSIVTVVGARPQFVKAAVLSRLLRSEQPRRFDEYLVHTGQHYDENMSEIFFREMDIPQPDLNLGVRAGTHGRMTGEMLARVEEVLLDRRPELLLVYGDTNSTLAGALAASKLGIPIVHVEAGLRSGLRSMPEEQNRILTDHLSRFLFCPSTAAADALAREGIVEGVHVVGDIMYDASLYYRAIAESAPGSLPDFPAGFALLTLHRAENTEEPSRLASIVRAVNAMRDVAFVFPMHPRTSKALAANGLRLEPHIRVIEPVGFLDMLRLESRCGVVLTDSGGVQKEAYYFGKPCITLRDQTEWTETVAAGWNTLVGADEARIQDAVRGAGVPRARTELYGDGRTAARILSVLEEAA